MLPLLSLLSILPSSYAQVTATFPNGVTNPDAPSFDPVGSIVNQTSYSRLLSLNNVDDFCLLGPPKEPDLIGNIEPIVVAYCTKPRNGARLIPDGTIHSAHFIKTDAYVQIYGLWDGTKIGMVDGDAGGELDPHGAEGTGNPIGGNVTSDVEGRDVFYEEWMSFISYAQFCMRICTAEPNNVSASLMCEHELDVMGCSFVMAIPDLLTSNNSFTSCEGEVAPPPGLYPQPGGGYSTFRQRYTGTWGGQVHTIGNEVTPSAPAFIPSVSNCFTYSSISNGVNTANFAVTAAPVLVSGSGSNTASGVGSTSVSGGIPSISTSAASSRGGNGSSARPSASGSGNADNAQPSGAAGTQASLIKREVIIALGLMVPAVMAGAAMLS